MSLSAVLFAFMYFLARTASQHVAWTLVAAVRAAMGAVVAIGIGKMRGVRVFTRGSRQMWMRSLFGVLAMMLTLYALGSPDASFGDAGTLINRPPAMIAVLGPIMLGERAGRRMALAIPLSLAGVVCIVRPAFLFGHDAASWKMLVPLGAAIASSFFSAIAMIMLRRVSDQESPEAIATHYSFTGAAICFALSIPTLGVPSARDLAMMIAGGAFAGLAQIAMTRAYALELAARVSPFGYLNVVVSAAMGALALAQWPDALSLFGMALVIAGGVVVSVASLRDHRRAS